MTTCRFCLIASGQLEHHVFYEDENVVAFLDRKPVNPGHTLIIPKQHIDYFFDMPDDLYIKIFERAKHLQAILKKSTKAKRIGFSISGFQVGHAHLHLIPLYQDHELDGARAKEATEEELQKMFELIQLNLHA